MRTHFHEENCNSGVELNRDHSAENLSWSPSARVAARIFRWNSHGVTDTFRTRQLLRDHGRGIWFPQCQWDVASCPPSPQCTVPDPSFWRVTYIVKNDTENEKRKRQQAKQKHTCENMKKSASSYGPNSWTLLLAHRRLRRLKRGDVPRNAVRSPTEPCPVPKSQYNILTQGDIWSVFLLTAANFRLKSPNFHVFDAMLILHVSACDGYY